MLDRLYLLKTAILLCMVYGTRVNADEPFTAAQVQRALDGLADNSSVLLPSAKIEGEFNELARLFQLDKRGPGPRDFTIKMVWSPERRTALYCGANHGSPHLLNDCWEFDLASNAWRLLFAPTYNYGRSDQQFNSKVVLKDGVVQAEQGGPVHLGHTWSQVAYDPVRKRLLWPLYRPGVQRLHEIYKFPKADVYDGPPLWSFNPAERKWEFIKTEGLPKDYFEATTLEYIPELKGTLLKGKWLLPSNENKWKALNPKGEARDFPGSEAVVAYDTVNRLLVVHLGKPEVYRGAKTDPTKRTWVYDVQANSWKLAWEGKDGPNGHDAWTSLGYDPVGQVVLTCDTLDGGKLWAYAAKKNQWTELKPRGPAPPQTAKGLLGYIDAAHNAYVVIAPTGTWVYRYKAK